MPNTELEVQLTLDDKFTEPLKSATKEVDQFRARSSEATKEGIKGTSELNKGQTSFIKNMKQSIKPVNDMQWAFMKLRFIWLATFAFAGASVLSLSKDFNTLDKSAHKLGMTSAELSIKLHGINIATPKAKQGVEQIKSFTTGLWKLWDGLKVLTAETVAEVTTGIDTITKVMKGASLDELGSPRMISTGTTGSVGVGQALDKNQKRMAEEQWSEERLSLELSTTEKINQLRMSETEFARHQLSQQIKDLKASKVTESKLTELEAAASKKIRIQEMQERASNYQQLWGMMSQTVTLAIGENKKYAGIMKALNIGDAIMNTSVAYTKALAQGGWFGIWMANAVLALGMAQVAVIAAQPMAKGGEGIVNKPTLFLAGEAGSERFSFTPLGRGKSSSSAGVSVFIENASFSTEDEAEDTLQRLSRLVEEKSRSRIR